MSRIWARSCALSGSNSTTGGSWATSVRTWPGVGGDQREPDDGPAAAAEDVCRCAAGYREQPVHVVGLLLRRHVLAGILAAAAARTTRVVGHDRVLASQCAGEPGEAGAVHREPIISSSGPVPRRS
jgi:hypothetical protein